MSSSLVLDQLKNLKNANKSYKIWLLSWTMEMELYSLTANRQNLD